MLLHRGGYVLETPGFRLVQYLITLWIAHLLIYIYILTPCGFLSQVLRRAVCLPLIQKIDRTLYFSLSIFLWRDPSELTCLYFYGETVFGRSIEHFTLANQESWMGRTDIICLLYIKIYIYIYIYIIISDMKCYWFIFYFCV